MKKQKNNISISRPTKFVIGIRNAGLDSCNAYFKGQFENSNPINLGLQICNLMGDQFAGEQFKPNFEYWLACRILKGLDFDRNKLFNDIDNCIETIKKFDLKNERIRQPNYENETRD